MNEDTATNPNAARKKAMDLLARREQTRGELLAKLRTAGFDADVASEVIATLQDEGLQSDTRFVESFVQSRVRQGKGPVRIRAELSQKGVADGLVDAAIDAADVDWRALARDVRQRKFGGDRPANFRDKARQMRFLQYRGFEGDQVHGAVGDD